MRTISPTVNLDKYLDWPFQGILFAFQEMHVQDRHSVNNCLLFGSKKISKWKNSFPITEGLVFQMCYKLQHHPVAEAL